MKRSKIVMILASLLPLFLFVFPMWNITLEAPQYPIPLGINIHLNYMEGAHDNDIQNISLHIQNTSKYLLQLTNTISDISPKINFHNKFSGLPP